MKITKVFYNKYWKHIIFLLSINPLINIFINMEKKIKIIDFYLKNIMSILGLTLLLLSGTIIYFAINKKRYNRLNFFKINTFIFAIFSVIFSIANYSFITTLIISIEIILVAFVLENRFIDFKKEKANDNTDKLYPSREMAKNRLKSILEEKDKNSLILINGEWGIGKTYFIDRILEEIKSEKNKEEIVPVKVDVLLFNDKNHLIKFTIEQINKILLENGIRSKSIGKYLDVIIKNINTIPNKLIKTVLSIFALFYDENYGDMKKNIKEDIEELENKEIVIIVDNLERTLDKKITIDILGFLHYIYEKLNLKIIVLADSSKLDGEINSEDYMKKFFIDTINLNSANYKEIIKDLPENEIFSKNQGIQKEIIDLFEEKQNKLKLEINGNIISINIDKTNDKSKESLEKEENDLEINRKKLTRYKAEYYKIMSKFENTRSYQSVKNFYTDIENQIQSLYNFPAKELQKYENVILSTAFYKEIYGNMTFEKTKLKEEYPLTYNLIYSNKSRNKIEESLIELLNNSKDNVLKAKEMIEEKIINKNIEDVLKNFKIYFDVFYSIEKEYK